MDNLPHTVTREWKLIKLASNSKFKEVYRFNEPGIVNLEGILLRPEGVASRTLVIFMHPAGDLHLLPFPNGLAAAGHHVLCARSRYAGNDSALIMENVVLDLGAYVREAKQAWGYDKVLLCGWSGGGSLSTFYQSQAENPTVTETPAGDAVDIVGAGLIPADAVMSVAAHCSRARILSEWIDPSVLDEQNPDNRDPELDLYRPGYESESTRFDAAFVQRFRTAQLTRMRKIDDWVLNMLDDLKRRGGAEVERGFVTQRTMADPRFVDTSIDPNGRPRLWTYMGHPETVNSGPAGLGRFSNLRSWLSQWSVDHSRADSLSAGKSITVPFLALECGADDAVPQPHTRSTFEAVASKDKTFYIVEGANHYYIGQPELLDVALRKVTNWIEEKNLAS